MTLEVKMNQIFGISVSELSLLSHFGMKLLEKSTEYRNFSKSEYLYCSRYKKLIFSGVLIAIELVLVADARP